MIPLTNLDQNATARTHLLRSATAPCTLCGREAIAAAELCLDCQVVYLGARVRPTASARPIAAPAAAA